MSTVISMACINQIKEYAEEKNYDKALALIREQDLSKSYNPQFLKMCADVFLDTKNYEEARKVLVMAHRIAPEGNKVNFSIIRLYLETGEFDLAREYFEQYEYNAFDGDEDLCWLRFMFARSEKEDGEKMLEVMMPLHTSDMSDALCYEFMRIYQLLGDTEKFEEEYAYLFDNFAESEYKEKAQRLKKEKCAAEELYIYPAESILDKDPQVDAEEKALLERDYLRMNPKEPEIMVMADDYGADEDMFFFKRSTLDKWTIRRREMAEKRAEKKKAKEELKKQKEAEREAKAAAMEEAAKKKSEEDNEENQEVALVSEEATEQPSETEVTAQEVVRADNVETESEEVATQEDLEDVVVEEAVALEEATEEEAVAPEETTEEEAVAPEEVTVEENVESKDVIEAPIEDVAEEQVEVQVTVESEKWSVNMEMTEIITEDSVEEDIFTSVEGVPGTATIEDVDLDVEAVLAQADSRLDAFKAEDDIPEEAEEDSVPDKHTQAFNEYDALLKREEEKLAEQFAMEEQLLLQAQSLLQSVESGVDDWNHKKRDNLFEAFESDVKRSDKVAKTAEINAKTIVDANATKEPVEKTEQKKPDDSVVKAKAEPGNTEVKSSVITAEVKKEEPASVEQKKEEASKPHIELREHLKAVLEIDATKKEILQKLKEGR